MDKSLKFKELREEYKEFYYNRRNTFGLVINQPEVIEGLRKVQLINVNR